MCNKCGKYDGGEVHLIKVSSELARIVREEAIKNVVRAQGDLVIATQRSDWDKVGNFVGNYSREFEIAEKYL